VPPVSAPLPSLDPWSGSMLEHVIAPPRGAAQKATDNSPVDAYA